MSLRFKVAGRIARPIHEVFEAVVDPGQLSEYFTTGGASDRLAPGTTVYWAFADHPGRFPVEVVTVEQDARIVLRWEASEVEDGNLTTVTMEFEPIDGDRTLVSITEEGWRNTEKGQAVSYANCEGWTNALCCMKAWIEHDINLREGFYA